MLKKIVIAAVAVAALGSTNGFAGGTNGPGTFAVTGANMRVDMTVVASCTVQVFSGVNFGSISVVSDAFATTPGQFNVKCDPNQDFAVGIGPGNNHAGNPKRNMLGQTVGARVPYELFTSNVVTGGFYDATTIFKDVTVGTSATGAAVIAGNVGGTGNNGGAGTTFNVYGQIATLGSKPAIDSYLDVVAIDLVY